MKVKFKTVMFEQDEEKYLDYVENHSVEDILKDFGQVCGLKVKQNGKEETIHEKFKEKESETFA